MLLRRETEGSRVNIKTGLVVGFLIFVVIGVSWGVSTAVDRKNERREKCVSQCLPFAGKMKNTRCYCDQQWKAPND